MQAILEGRPLSSDGLEWLRDGVLFHLETGEALHICLGLKRRKYLMTIRNYHIANALALILPGSSRRRKIKELQDEVNRVYKIWPDCKDLDKPDPRWSRLRQEIFLALKCQPVFPASRQLENIAKSNSDSIS